MLTFFIFFVSSVLLWLIVSLLILYRVSKNQSPSSLLPPEPLPEESRGHPLEVLLENPEVKAWFILNQRGDIVRQSATEPAEMEDPFFKFVKWTQSEAIDLKLADIQIMKQDTEQRTMILSFSQTEAEKYYLLLYLDPVKHEVLHRKLNELNWNDLRQMIEGTVNDEESN